jgi:hypothetical protein
MSKQLKNMTYAGTVTSTGLLTASGALTVNGTFTEAGKSYCYIYKDVTSNNISATLGTTPLQIVGTFSTVSKSSDFTVTASGGAIQYTGAATKKFELGGVVTCDSSNPRTMYWQWSLDGGSTFLATGVNCYNSNNTGYFHQVAFNGVITMTQNQTLTLWVSCTSSTTSLNTRFCNFNLNEKVGF